MKADEKIPVILIHGWGLSGSVFHKTREELSKRLGDKFDFQAFNLPGYGSNAGIPGNRSMGITQFLENNLPEKAVILGWSLGGVLALRYAIFNPDRVKALITVASSPRFCALEEEHWPGTDAKLLDKFASELTQENSARVVDKFLSLQAMGSLSMKNDIREIRQLLAKDPLPSYYELISGLKTLQDEDLRNSVTRLKCPSLHMYGANDRLVPASGKNIWPQTAKTLIHIFEKSSHAPFISEPEEFLKIMEDFLRNYCL